MYNVKSLFCVWLIASLISWSIGFVALGLSLDALRRTVPDIDRKEEKPFTWLLFVLGGVERTTAITLALLTPNLLAPFIGGWITLKFAAGWLREQPHKKGIMEGSFIALIGSVLSFGIAILSIWIVHRQIIAEIGAATMPK